jgi:DNA-directed RNA polymerase subunit F
MEEKYLTLSEIKEQLEKEQKEREELLAEQKLALEHAKKFSKLSPSKAAKLVKQLTALEKVSEPLAVKIADLMPTHNDDLQALFAKERTSLTKEELDQILDIVRKFE